MNTAVTRELMEDLCEVVQTPRYGNYRLGVADRAFLRSLVARDSDIIEEDTSKAYMANMAEKYPRIFKEIMKKRALPLLFMNPEIAAFLKKSSD